MHRGEGNELDEAQKMYTPGEIADKIKVEPYMIRVYCKEFADHVEQHAIRTKENTGHRRFSEAGLQMFHEIKRLLDRGYKYHDIRIELDRRQELNIGSVASVMDYENQQMLKTTNEGEKLILNQLHQLAQSYSDIVQTNKQLAETIKSQELEMSALRQQIVDITNTQDKQEKEWATIKLKEIEERKKPNWLQRILGIRNIEIENEEKEYYIGIKNRVRPEIVVPTKIEKIENE